MKHIGTKTPQFLSPHGVPECSWGVMGHVGTKIPPSPITSQGIQAPPGHRMGYDGAHGD